MPRVCGAKVKLHINWMGFFIWKSEFDDILDSGDESIPDVLKCNISQSK